MNTLDKIEENLKHKQTVVVDIPMFEREGIQIAGAFGRPTHEQLLFWAAMRDIGADYDPMMRKITFFPKHRQHQYQPTALVFRQDPFELLSALYPTSWNDTRLAWHCFEDTRVARMPVERMACTQALLMLKIATDFQMPMLAQVVVRFMNESGQLLPDLLKLINDISNSGGAPIAKQFQLIAGRYNLPLMT